MSTIVIMPGGFHPFHAGHAALYQSAKKAFPNAEVFVAATNDTKTRPFPFAIKEKLAKLAGVEPGHFVQVKSPFQPKEITNNFNPEQDVVIFVRSEKDRNESPKPGGMKKDGTPAYFQPWTGKDVQPFGKQAYIAYLPTVEFGPGIKSATEIRNAWPKLDDRRKTAMVMSLYPVTQKNPKLAANVVKMLDMGMGNELAEESDNPARDSNTDIRAWAKEILLKQAKAHFINDIKNQRIVARGMDEKILGVFNRATNKPNIFIEGELSLDEGPIVQRIIRPNKVNIYLRINAKTPPKLVATDIPYDILDKYVDKVVNKYPQFKQTDFSFKSADKVDENMGLPYPATYEEENQIHKDGPMRITAMTSESNLSESLDYLEEK